MDYIFLIFWFGVFSSSFQTIGSVCTFPSNLVGSWVRVQDDVTFVITADTVTGFDYHAGGQPHNNFVCEQIKGDMYLLVQSITSAYTGNPQFTYLCINIEVLGNNSIVFTDLAALSGSLVTRDSAVNDPTNLVYVKGVVTTTADLKTVDVCTSEVAQVKPEVLYISGIGSTEGAIGVTCPESIFGNYNYTVDGTQCPGNSSLSMCADRKSMVANYTQCGYTVAYSLGGILDCMGNVTRGDTIWLWVYNRDATIDNLATFRTTCFAIQGSEKIVTMTSHPRNCLVGQDHTSIPSPGHKFDMVALKLCPLFIDVDVVGPPIAIIAGSTVGGLIFVAAIVVLIAVLCHRSRAQRVVSPKTESSKAKDANGVDGKAAAVANGTAATVVTVNETTKPEAKPAPSKSPEMAATPKESPAKESTSKSPAPKDKNAVEQKQKDEMLKSEGGKQSPENAKEPITKQNVVEDVSPKTQAEAERPVAPKSALPPIVAPLPLINTPVYIEQETAAQGGENAIEDVQNEADGNKEPEEKKSKEKKKKKKKKKK